MKEVAVVTPSHRDYLIWLKENQKPGETYIKISRLKDAVGRFYDRVEKLYNYYELEDIYEILEYLTTHTRYTKIWKD